MPDEEQTYHPEMKEKANGLFCFLNNDRPCGTDCMAYADPPMAKGPDYDGKQWANCVLLVSAHQTGKHAAVVAGQLSQLTRKANTPGVPPMR